MDKDLDFNEFLKKRLKEDEEDLKNLPYSMEEIIQIYQQEYVFIKSIPELELKMESQDINYEIMKYYLPEKWELVRKGKLLYSDEEVLKVLQLLIFNIGVKKSLDLIPRTIIEKYLNDNKDG